MQIEIARRLIDGEALAASGGKEWVEAVCGLVNIGVARLTEEGCVVIASCEAGRRFVAEWEGVE